MADPGQERTSQNVWIYLKTTYNIMSYYVSCKAECSFVLIGERYFSKVVAKRLKKRWSAIL